MYSAFAEITDYVKTNGLGQYTVADIALVEGNGGGTGYYGGWGIIVVYENSKMKWRDITVFDGHAYVQGSTTVSHEIPISGFNAVQTGQVNIKLGLMAGEGDRSISGDYFNIRRSSDNNWQALNHTGNGTNNFFNSMASSGFSLPLTIKLSCFLLKAASNRSFSKSVSGTIGGTGIGLPVSSTATKV
jgi:hypothetical protein